MAPKTYGTTPMNRTMYHEDRKVTDRGMLCAMLDLTSTCCLGLHDSPYPYVVPMNFGYTWEDEEGLVLYLHMATTGHKLTLIERDPHVCVTVSTFYDRFRKKIYRDTPHDYRSVMVFGIAEEVTDPEERLFALQRVGMQTGRPPYTQIPASEKPRLKLFKVRAEEVIGKAQYPIGSVEEVAMPVFEE